MSSLHFRTFLQDHPDLFNYFKIIFQKTWVGFQNFEKKYFHLGFKVQGLAHFRPINVRRWFSQMNIQQDETYKTINFVVN
jgi:hypothetical protein